MITVRTPVQNRLAYGSSRENGSLDGDLDHRPEIVVALAADIGVARIDAVLGERAGARRVLLEQQVAVVVEVPDDRNIHAECGAGVHDFGHGGGGGFGVHRDPHQFASGARQRHYLVHGGSDIGGIGIGHRLYHDGVVPANLYFPDTDRH